MGFLGFFILLIVIGFVLYLVFKYIPMAPGFREAAVVVAILFLILLFLQLVGLVGGSGLNLRL